MAGFSAVLCFNEYRDSTRLRASGATLPKGRYRSRDSLDSSKVLGMKFHLLAVALLFTVVLGGCTANRMSRRESIQQEADHTMAFIEFDDQGEMWDPAQRSRAVTHIGRANHSDGGTVIVTYIHGWQHNASQKSEENGNVADFKEYLGFMAERLAARYWSEP